MKLVVNFYPPEHNGRAALPDLSSGTYRPHLVIDSDEEGSLLGVQFMDFDNVVAFNTNTEVTVRLPYANVGCSKLKPAVSFTIREGRHFVGIGSVKAL